MGQWEEIQEAPQQTSVGQWEEVSEEPIEKKKKGFVPKALSTLGGIGEAGLSLATGIPAWMASRAAQTGWIVAGGASTPMGLARSHELANKLSSAVTYKPKTKLGENITKVASYPFSLPEKGIEKIPGIGEEAKAGLKIIVDTAMLAPAFGKGFRVADMAKSLPRAGKISPFGTTPKEGLSAMIQGKKMIESVTPIEKEVWPKIVSQFEKNPNIGWKMSGENQVFYLKKNELQAANLIDRLTKLEEGIKKDATRPTEADIIERGKIYGYSDADIQTFLNQPKETPIAPWKDNLLTAYKALEYPKKLKEQKQIYARERAGRFEKFEETFTKNPTEEGYYQALGSMEGPLTHIPVKSLREMVSPGDVTSAYQSIAEHPAFNVTDKLAASRALNDWLGGKLPQKKALEYLREVVSPEVVKTTWEKMPWFQKAKQTVLELSNVPRTLMASFGDLSFGGRQGIFAAPRFYKEFGRSWAKQFEVFGSEKAYREVMDSIRSDPDFNLARKSGVPFTEIGQLVTKAEEKYMGAKWTAKIPGLGRIVNMTNRAYTAFANRYRMDIFKKLVSYAEDLGLDPRSNIEGTTKIGHFVGNITGRGAMPGAIERSAVALNAFFFSPRLQASRLNLLEPTQYVRSLVEQVGQRGFPQKFKPSLNSFSRKEATKTMLTFGAAGTTILTLAKLAGARVEADPRSADFAKIKVGNTRIDIFGGYTQYVRLAAQLLSQSTVSATTGKVTKLGEGYKPLTTLDVAGRFVEYKEAPIASFLTNLLRGRSTFGEKFSITSEMVKRLVPMVAQDFWEIYNDDPSLLPVGLFGVFGFGVQTYGLKNPKTPMGQELDRLKLSLPWLSRVSGQDKIPKESYQKLSEASKAAIEQALNQAITTPGWAQATNEQKIKYIESQAKRIKKHITKSYLPEEPND